MIAAINSSEAPSRVRLVVCHSVTSRLLLANLIFLLEPAVGTYDVLKEDILTDEAYAR